jgi:hypothetical protein
MKKVSISKVFFVFVILFFFARRSDAQVNSLIFNTKERPYTTAVAINPKNVKNIVVGTVQGNINFSSDEGQTWQASGINPRGIGSGGAILTVDLKGNFYYFYRADTAYKKSTEENQMNRFIIQHSDNGGKTWDANDGPGFDSLHRCGKFSATADNKGNLYLTWTQFDGSGNDSACETNIMFSKSTNKGKKWSQPIKLSQKPGDCVADSTVGGAMASIINDGKIFVAWSNQNKIFIDRSYDEGDMWLNNDIYIRQMKGESHMKIKGFDNPGSLLFMADNSVGRLANSLYLLSTEKKEFDDTDILLMRSQNGGDNWSSPIPIHKDEPGTLQFKPVMAIDKSNGYIYVAYFNQKNPKNDETDVFIAYSTNGGDIFKSYKITEKAFVPAENDFNGPYISLSVSNGVIIPVWYEKSELKIVVIKYEDLIKK